MPLYDYRCRDCDHSFEAMQKYGEPAPACPSCEQGKVEKLMSAPAVAGASEGGGGGGGHVHGPGCRH